jgi:sugar O-acyltransferase (sialic acid O-acetyltransferase NeuD family)
MTATPLVIVGAGGHAREMLDVVRAMNASTPTFDVLGFVDDGHPDTSLLDQLGTPFLGPMSELEKLGAAYVIGVGMPEPRKRIDQQLSALGLEPAVLVHPRASIGADVELGPGSVVCAHASITTHVRTGRHVHLNLGARVAHDSVVADYGTLLPNATVSGDVTLEEGVMLGTNSAVIQGLRVGAWTVVGAGAVVIRDLPAGVTAVGVPAVPSPSR